MQYYDSLLPMFLSRDELRPALCQVNTVGDYVYSTDAHGIIIVPKSKCKNEYPAHPKAPNYHAVLDMLVPYPEPIQLATADLVKVLKNCPKCYDTHPCQSCDGEGSIECNLNHFHECEDCEGKGAIVDETLPMVYDFEASVVKLDSAWLSPHLLGNLESVATLLKAEHFQLTHGTQPRKAYQFVINEDVRVILMPRDIHEPAELKRVDWKIGIPAE